MLTQWKQLKLPEKQHEPLSAVHNELLTRQLTLLPGLLLEQLQQMSMLQQTR